MEKPPETARGDFASIQVPTRVHRKLKAACVHAKVQIGQITSDTMEAWADSVAKELGFTFPAEDPD